MKKAALYQMCQTDEAPSWIKKEIRKLAAGLDLDVQAVYMDQRKPRYLIKPSAVFEQMLADTEAGKFKVLMVEEMCEFGQSPSAAFEGFRTLKGLGIQVYLGMDNADDAQDGVPRTAPSDTEFSLALLAALAADERCKQRESVQWGICRASGVKV